MGKYAGLLALCLFGFFSCRKDCNYNSPPIAVQTADTIFPHQYFPAYPGSWWEYSDTTSITIDANWFDHVLKIDGPDNKNGCPSMIEIHNFVPKTNDDFVIYDGTIKKLSYWTQGNDSGYQDTGYEINLFPTATDGTLFSQGFGRSWRTFYEFVDSVVTPAGTFYDVLGFTEHKEAYGSDHNWHDVSWDTIYYAKDVGIVRQTTTKWYVNSPSVTKELTSYFINN